MTIITQAEYSNQRDKYVLGRCGKTGVATTFINKDVEESALLDLKHLLIEAKQRWVVTQWIESGGIVFMHLRGDIRYWLCCCWRNYWIRRICKFMMWYFCYFGLKREVCSSTLFHIIYSRQFHVRINELLLTLVPLICEKEYPPCWWPWTTPTTTSSTSTEWRDVLFAVAWDTESQVLTVACLHIFHFLSSYLCTYVTSVLLYTSRTYTDCPKLDKDARRIGAGKKDALAGKSSGYGGDWWKSNDKSSINELHKFYRIKIIIHRNMQNNMKFY